MEVLDAVSPLERVRLTGELGTKAKELPEASALAKVGIAARIAQIIKELGGSDTPAPAIIEHTTGKGKVIRGVVRTDLSYQEAKAIDEYTFKKDGGWFIREKHLANVTPYKPGPAQPQQIRNFGWDAVKLSDLTFEQLAELRKQVEAEHANPQNEAGRYIENGSESLYLYDKKGRWKLDRLAWAVAYKLGDKRAAEKQREEDARAQEQAEADRLANERLREEAKRKERADKLRAVARSTIEKAEQELGRERLSNTSRRANMAASAEAKNENDLALGKTMLNLADAIESGEATHLSGINSKAAVVVLQNALVSAMGERDKTRWSYSESQQHKGRPAEPADVAFARYPTARWDSAGASRARLLEVLKGKRGVKELVDRIKFATEASPEDIDKVFEVLGDKEAGYQLGWWNVEQAKRVKSLRRVGIANLEDLRSALTEYMQHKSGARAADPIKAAERAIIGKKVGIDFFPTPTATAQRMAQLASIQAGDRVLEPSAGNGNLADAAKAAGGVVDVIEISSQLREILTAKGYTVVANDFDDFSPVSGYDAIIMNPPFSDRKDAAHIMRAFDMLAPGGRLVAIAGEGVFNGSDRKAQEFRDWLESHSAEVEQLPQNTFMDKSLLSTTGANARVLVMQRG